MDRTWAWRHHKSGGGQGVSDCCTSGGVTVAHILDTFKGGLTRFSGGLDERRERKEESRGR